MMREITMPRILSFTVRTRLGAVTIRSIVDAGNSKSPVKHHTRRNKVQSEINRFSIIT
jgi:hypothetical protein